ncbi:MAG: RNA pseudouridine synthase [Clostridia bacterium]|nr:RNA pseudouridine synthase [Clostridia bacterium]
MPDILYMDNHVLVAIKPPNMLSQADNTGDTDIQTLLKEVVRQQYHKPGNVYLGLVHRLDRPVGGLMVFARTSKAAARLTQQMKEHTLGRQYLCIVTGSIPDSFTLIDYLVKDERLNHVSVCGPGDKGAQEAVLHGRCLMRRDQTALVAVRLQTGRSHQIRVQLAHAGAPLWGDNRYGNGMAGQQIALWGYRLDYIHPTLQVQQSFMSMPYGGIWMQYEDVLADIWHTFQRDQAASMPASSLFSD